MPPQTRTFEEKRAYRRVPINTPVNYHVISDGNGYGSIARFDEVKASNSMDISVGGLYLSTVHTLDPGSILGLKISLPSKTEWVSAFGEVAWSNKTGSGLRFLAMHDDDVKALKDFIDKNLTSAILQ